MFSIVVPLWNSRDTVRETVGSVLAQTYDDFELIVVDDGSTDDSVATLAGVDDPRLRILRQSNAGPGLARNAGIAAAKADWIAFLDADDLWLPDHLAELDRIRARFPQAGLIGTAYIQADGSGSFRPPDPGSGAVREVNFFERIALGDPLLFSSSAAVSRRTVEALGDFPADRFGQDMRYWMRIALAMPVAVSTRSTAIYRPLPTGLSASLGSLWRGRTLTGPGDVSHRIAFLLDRYDAAPAALKPGIDRFIDREFRWCLRHSARDGDLATIRALRPLYLRRPRGGDRLLLGAARLPAPAARFLYRGAAAIIPPLRRAVQRLRG
ncbi:MAG TPA: glycosyltransferase family 2 protein [Allosphingosinicella sp.]|nr:glycosyltransferase family 2 protein [Allosphingosinicella sp.]